MKKIPAHIKSGSSQIQKQIIDAVNLALLVVQCQYPKLNRQQKRKKKAYKFQKKHPSIVERSVREAKLRFVEQLLESKVSGDDMNLSIEREHIIPYVCSPILFHLAIMLFHQSIERLLGMELEEKMSQAQTLIQKKFTH